MARAVDYVYDFALPPLILHALTAADAAPLRTWLALRPGKRSPCWTPTTASASSTSAPTPPTRPGRGC